MTAKRDSESLDLEREPLSEALYCISCGCPATVRGLDHSHIVARSQAPGRVLDPTNIVLQCRRCHDNITEKKWGHRIVSPAQSLRTAGDAAQYYCFTADGEQIMWVSVVVDEQRAHLVPVESSATESRVSRSHASGADSTAAEPPAGVRSNATEGVDSVVAAPAGFILDDWCRRGMWLVYSGERLRRVGTEYAFEVGDWVNEGEAALGETAQQFLGHSSYWQLATWSSVARRVPPLSRDKDLPFTYHREVAALPEPEQREWLAKARNEDWRRQDLHAAIHGEPQERERHLCPTCGAEHLVKA